MFVAIKKKPKFTAEPKKKISPCEEGRAFLFELEKQKNTLDNIKKFVAGDVKNQDEEIKKKEVVKAKNLLPLIKKGT